MTGKKDQKKASVFKGQRLIESTAIVNQLAVAAHKDKISFTSLNLTGHQNEIVTEMVKEEREVLLTISLDGPPDKSFPPIQVQGKLKGYKISKTCDSPDVVDIKFSQSQVSQLAGYIRGEHLVVLRFTEVQGDLPFEDNE